VALKDEASQWTLEVEDDGVGITDEAQSRASSLGLLGIRERVEALRGRVHIGRRDTRGTSVTIGIPRPVAEVSG
jgi:signal transduction histidine kinase